MQSLYSYLTVKGNDISAGEKAMLKHFDELVELKLVMISLLVEIAKHADNFYKDAKNKYLPTARDLDPNIRFVKNKVIVNIQKNQDLINSVSRVSGIWLNNDHDIVRKLFSVIVKSELYDKYLSFDEMSVNYEKKFIIDLMNDYVFSNKLVHHILEERSIYWIDDLPFIAAVIFGDIKDDIEMNVEGPFKNVSDKDFALDLFRDVVKNNAEYEQIITKFAVNWELDRIAKMDQLFLKMAFSEILSMPTLPVKVSMNEYIEISKYYSTSKSKLFVNGLLDSFVKTYSKEGKIKKVGRGLV